MGGLGILLIALTSIVALGIMAGIVNWLLRRFPSQAKAILVLAVFAYMATVLVMCVNSDFDRSYRGGEPDCPGPPRAAC